MLEYYKEEEATKEVKTEDGYLKTGDIGYTEDKVLFVTGRKKNLIILGNGKNVSPEYLEAKLYELPYVKECLVVEKKIENKTSILLAKIFPEGDYALFDRERMDADLKRVNDSLASYMRIDDYEIMEQEFEKTSTKKIKRNIYV